MAYTAHSSSFRADALDHYLARFGEAPLLTHAEEKELAGRIEEAEFAVARALLRCPAAGPALAEIADDLASGRVKARELTRRPMSLDEGELAAESGLSVEKVSAAIHPWREPESLEAPTGVEGDIPLGDRIEDARAEDPFERIAAARRARETRSLLTILRVGRRSAVGRRSRVHNPSARHASL